MAYLTPQMLQALRPDLDAKTAEVVATKLEAALTKFGVITGDAGKDRNRLAHVLSQLAQESGFRPVSENLNYSAERLQKTWPSRFTPQLAAQCAKQPEKIANLVYCDRLGNGNTASGEGWKYAGKGLLQLTGKENYAKYGALIGYDLVGDPSLALQIGIGCLIVGAYFANHKAKFGDGKYYGGFELMDRGEGAVAQVTYFVNGGQHGLPERTAYYKKALELLGGGNTPAAPQSGFHQPAGQFYYPVPIGDGPNGWGNGVGQYLDPAYYAEVGSVHPAADLNQNRLPGEGADKDFDKPFGAYYDGTVIAVEQHRVIGWLIQIEHVDPRSGEKFWSSYWHANRVLVKAGDKVRGGQKIGTVGKGGGNRFPAHLHWELRKFPPAQLATDFWPSGKYPNRRDAEACVERNYFSPMKHAKEHGAINPVF